MIWHLAMLNGLAMITGALAHTWWIAPKAIVLSKSHLLGVLSAVLAVLVFIATAHAGLLHYGIFLSGAFVIADGYLTYRAFVRRKRRR